MSVSIENFIKTIYKLEHGTRDEARPGLIAGSLGISNAAATDMARKLAAKGLIDYQKYQKFCLTDKGRKMAVNIIRKHRLWESFLKEVFNLSMHEIHREAEMLEHQTSDFLAEKIDEYLGNPEVDPHGDPIPDTGGEMNVNEDSIGLSVSSEGKSYKITRLFSSDEDFFRFCESNNMQIGSEIEVIKQYGSNMMTEIRIEDIKIVLNREFAENIYVEEISD